MFTRPTHFLYLFFVGVALFALFPLPGVAQGDMPMPELANTATETLSQLSLWLASLAGVLGSRITERVKALPVFSPEQKTELSRILTEFSAFIIAAFSGAIVGGLANLAGLIDQSGVWAVVLLAYPVALGYFQVDQRRKVAKQTAATPSLKGGG